MIVQAIFDKISLPCEVIELGEVEVTGDISAAQMDQLRTGLLEAGLELIDDKKGVLIEKVKNVIVELVHYTDERECSLNCVSGFNQSDVAEFVQ